MTNVTRGNFGLLIAYLLPGYVVVATLADHFPAVATWLGTLQTDTPTVGGFLYATLASVGAGLAVSTVRWLTIDRIHHATGIQPPAWDFASLQKNLDAFEGVVEAHFRYAQFYGGMIIALAISIAGHGLVPGSSVGAIDVLSLLLIPLFFAGSRDALSKYYQRTQIILSGSLSHRRQTMTNGWHPKKSDGKQTQPKKASSKPAKAGTEKKSATRKTTTEGK